ncbi:aldo/keto reductase [Castellaniella ginsengisoli]|uniref:Aldo/keto reductase n=1 Tax=Castellaniella ginsengisoli TaxID=546114 RepID=A0AB39D5T5_9BURK
MISCQNSRITLGTAQFGLAYGVANTAGKLDLGTVQLILARACSNGIRSLDTAIAYGDSEQVLGAAGVSDFEIGTKLPEIPEYCDIDVPAWVSAHVQESLRRLRVECLDSLLLHRPGQLLSAKGDKLYRALQYQVALGRVRRIGISIYDPAELDLLIPHFPVDLVQAPLNLLDGRLESSGWHGRMQRMGIALHVRSIFLQGLLLMPAERRPLYFEQWAALWATWSAWLDEHCLTPLQACLRYALHIEGVERVVLGVDSVEQLDEILVVANEGPIPDSYRVLQTQDAALLNPSRWKLE